MVESASEFLRRLARPKTHSCLSDEALSLFHGAVGRVQVYAWVRLARAGYSPQPPRVAFAVTKRPVPSICAGQHLIEDKG